MPSPITGAPPFYRETWTFANTDHLQAVLKVYGGNDVAGVVRQQIDNPKLPVKQRASPVCATCPDWQYH